jgi:hypothetical protein
MSSAPHWETIGPPPLRRFAVDQARAVRELALGRARRGLLRRAPRGDGHPVLVLPGLLAGDLTTAPLRSFLRALCYDARGWRLGVNAGPTPALRQRLEARLAHLAERHGRKVSFSPGRVVRRLLDRAGLLALLEVQAFSDEVGVPKPERRIFERALAGLGSAPGAALHVGDLRRTDVAGARELGMRTVRIRHHHDDCSDHPEADHVADTHAALRDLLGVGRSEALRPAPGLV